MDEFRIALISIGIFAIVGILAHGMWTIRKNNKLKEEGNREASSRHRDPEIVISDDDPLLSADNLSESIKTEVEHSETSAPDYAAAPEADPLVGDAPLYDNSDLAFNAQTSAPTVSAAQASDSRPSAPSIDSESTIRSESEHFDEDGIGSVRVVDEVPSAPLQKQASQELADDLHNDDEDLPEPPSSLLRKDEPAERKRSIDDVPMIDTSIDIDDSPRNEKRSGALKSEHTRTEVVGGNRLGKKAESITEKAKKLVGMGSETKTRETSTPAAKPGKKPKADPNKDQIRLDLEASPEPEVNASHDTQENDADQAPENEVLILNVRVPEGKVIQGAALLPSLLTLGFKFGEHNMFHRHAASNGKGPRLFTLANMFNPGTFDIDNMENFNSTGVSLFMTLPIDADAHQVFNMMHNAARKLADEFGAQVLDGRRSVLTRQSLQQYVEKIREFERRRMIRRG